MRVCHCTLPTFYPGACNNCPNNPIDEWAAYKPQPGWNIPPKKITEKFDDKGNLIERITEE